MTESSRYLTGIMRAIENGHVQFSDDASVPDGPDDVFTHLDHKLADGIEKGGIHRFNASPLPEAVSCLMRTFSRKAIHCLESGPGAGFALSELQGICRHAILHTISLTPINPFLKFAMSYREVKTHLANAVVHPGLRRDIPGDLLCRLEAGIAMDRLSVEWLLSLQEHVPLKIVEETDAPFISLQKIGVFPEQISLNPGLYQLIYEQFGAVCHSQSIRAVRELWHGLAEDGVLLLNDMSFRETCIIVSALPLAAGDVVLFSDNGEFLAAKSGSTVARSMNAPRFVRRQVLPVRVRRITDVVHGIAP